MLGSFLSYSFNHSNGNDHYNWETFFFVCLVLIGTVLLMDFFTAIRNTFFPSFFFLILVLSYINPYVSSSV